jgi:ribosome-associated protein YbcJ (S4-like RNA binding protein)
MGHGRVQLRLPVGIINGAAYLCEAYVKSNEKVEKRKLSKFKDHLQLIRQNRHIVMGRLI